jgi:hypothetical protein
MPSLRDLGGYSVDSSYHNVIPTGFLALNMLQIAFYTEGVKIDSTKIRA